ncbi:MAG: penicillin-insensitive murein endopeptidase [Deltaproteobacteria bacterium]|jgi:LysM repeat protein|nr:penicillin-insensitive murein endopeptidase [Deltaproteobacteria bacterium]
MRPRLFAMVVALLLASSGVGLEPASAADPKTLVSREVVVRRGETLKLIARRNGVAAADLRKWNKSRIGKGDLIREGMTLVVKVPADSALATQLPEAGRAKAEAGKGAKKPTAKAGAKVEAPKSGPLPMPPGMWEDSVVVRRGDTLSRIANRIEVKLEDLMAWNRLGPKSKLQAGKRLVVYRPGPRPAPRSEGRPTAGTLAYGLHLGEGVGYRLRFPKNAFGVEGVLKTLRACPRKVRDAFPGTHDVLIGDVSRPGGGRFPPHESHQSGRDADVGYYLASNVQNVTMHRVKADDVDFAKTWALLKCFLTTDQVVRVYMDRNIQVAMVDFLRTKKIVNEGQIQRLFAVEGGEGALVVHAKEHDTHLHVRFACDAGQTGCVEEPDEEPFQF